MKESENANGNGNESVKESVNGSENESVNVNGNGKKRERKREKGVRDKSARRNGKRKGSGKEEDTRLDPHFINIHGPPPMVDRLNPISPQNPMPPSPCPATYLRYRIIPGCRCPPTCWTDHVWDYTRQSMVTTMVHLILSETFYVEWIHYERVWIVSRSF